jgi:hypothetical protein
MLWEADYSGLRTEMRRILIFGAEISWQQKQENGGVQERKTGLSDLMQMFYEACTNKSSEWVTTVFLFGLIFYEAVGS